MAKSLSRKSSDASNGTSKRSDCTKRGTIKSGKTAVVKKVKDKGAHGGLIQCDICLRRCIQGILRNIGHTAYPKWRCAPCDNSSKVYERALKSRGVDVGFIKKSKWSRYRIQVCSFRIAHPLDNQCEGGEEVAFDHVLVFVGRDQPALAVGGEAHGHEPPIGRLARPLDQPIALERVEHARHSST